VRCVSDFEYLVRSQSTATWYRVKWRKGRWLCECADYLKKMRSCKHAHAVSFLLRLPEILSANPDCRIPNVPTVKES